MQLGIDRGTCWKRENSGDKHGARRRSIRIDAPRKGQEDALDHCLKMYKDEDQNCATESYDAMSFSQNGTPVSLHLGMMNHKAHHIKLRGQSATHSIRAMTVPMKSTTLIGSSKLVA